MKPNEDYVIGQEDLVAQLALLILQGRTSQDIKSNLKDRRYFDAGLFHHRKEDFSSLWKSCDSMYIEVWVCHHEQFVEEEAMNGHSSYLLIEQWQIDIKLNRNSGHGFHCTDKMLTQAVKSKLYFSQLSAWLSRSKGEFPRHTYFRLCEAENKTPLKRFIKAPEHHQFPYVNLTPTKNLVVSLHSLPHSDIFQEFPLFLWVVPDLPMESPQHTSGENLTSIVESHSKAHCSLHVVRKLEFGNDNATEDKVSEKRESSAKHVETISEISENSTTQPKQTSECFLDENKKLSVEKEIDFSHEKCERKVDQISSTMVDFDSIEVLTQPSSSPQSSDIIQNPSVLNEYIDKCLKLCASNSSNASSSSISESKESHCSGKEFCKTSSISQKQIFYDKTNQERVKPNISSSSDRTDNSRVGILQEESFRTKENYNLEDSQSSENFNTDLGFGYDEISKKSSLMKGPENRQSTTTNSHILECSKHHVDCKVVGPGQSGNVQYFKVPPDKDRSKKEPDCPNRRELNSKDFDETMKSSWSVNKFGNVFHGTKKDVKNILPQVRHVMEQECEKKLQERLRKCCVPSGSCGETEPRSCKGKRTGASEDEVFSEQKCTSIPVRHSSISRYHFRHASTGTLPIFHPSTGLPVSSSPAPFRKSPQKQSVDDICSPPRESTSLSDCVSNLSKSAPTLTTQSLLVNFEESVLNDRLLPDGVVEGFTAELSASGSKKCLAHVTLPVQAYFFKLSDDNAPSPYMGYISLDVPGVPKKGYHVPKKGTIQLTLFNPNQTVVKVFVVLYDFSDMEPNFQTFLRQKTTSLVKLDAVVDRIHDNLHYLIHLRFASSKSGRVYLHTDIRVIFARHPPDQVYLRTATTGPTNPKYVPRQDTQEELV